MLVSSYSIAGNVCVMGAELGKDERLSVLEGLELRLNRRPRSLTME